MTTYSYVFWHQPLARHSDQEYGAALMRFQAALMQAGVPGLSFTTSRAVARAPWLPEGGYEDWYVTDSWAALEGMNHGAVAPAMHPAHNAVAELMQSGTGSIFKLLRGQLLSGAAPRVFWLTRPRGIRFEADLALICESANTEVACWRRQLVLGPSPEFLLECGRDTDLELPAGWTCLEVRRQDLAG